jgi:hypothetical protein
MRGLIGLIVIVYLVGVGVVLAPTVSGKWSTVPASELTASIIQGLPAALAWPAGVYRSLTGRADAPSSDPQSKSP